jgi:DNA-binding beta-propeller fold protein YncE
MLAGTTLTALCRATAAWLWTGRSGVLAGRSAAALHGAKWVNDDAPAQILHRSRRAPSGIDTWSDRFEDDEVQIVSGLPVTTPARTALDLACRLPVDDAVVAIDGLTYAVVGEPEHGTVTLVDGVFTYIRRTRRSPATVAPTRSRCRSTTITGTVAPVSPVIATIPLGSPGGVTLSADGATAYVTNRLAGTVSVIGL